METKVKHPQKYTSYKDSSIEWIGEIPSHWDAMKLGLLLSANDGGVWGNDGGETNVLRSTEINIDGTWNFEEAPAKRDLSESEIRKALLLKGDLLVTKSSGSELHIGKTAIVDDHVAKMNCCYSNFMQRLRVKDENNPRLYFHFLNSLLAREQYNYLSNTTTGLANLGAEILANVKIPVPTPEEQTTIANYLDRKTAEIDELISDKKRLLGLYEEEKTAIINQAVTKGINPDAPMKNSGIEWLGEIPEHWEVKRLKMLVSKVGSGVTPSGGSTVYMTSGIPLLRSQNIHFDGLHLDDVAFISEEIDEGMSNSRIQEGDVLLNITGASIGRCFYVPIGFGRGNVNQHVCIIRPIAEKVDTVYMYLLMRSEIGQIQIWLQQTGANREGLNFEQLKNFNLPLPLTLKEQQSIVLHIATETTNIDAKKAKTEKLIGLLTEYRTALISEVVTGKIKVIE